MKKIILVISLLLPLITFGQLQIDAELENKLAGKSKFSEIKEEVLNHYKVKLNGLKRQDSVEYKKVIRQLKMWNRNFWINENYVNKDGIVDDFHKVNEEGLDQLKEITREEKTNRYQPNNWILQGPFNGDKGIGRFDKITFDPTNQNIIYATSAYGGLFKSTNGGNSWFAIGDFIPSLGIADIVIDPTNPAIVYVLTGDSNSNGGCFNGSVCFALGEHRSASKGVYKSYDGGFHWFRTGRLWTGTSLYRGTSLLISPANPDILHASTSKGIYRTINGGGTWTLETDTFLYQELKFKPGDPNIIYATSGNLFRRSTNGGDTYATVNTGTLLSGADRISIGTTPANASKVLLFAGPGINATNFQGLFISTNSGADNSFSLLTNTPNLFYNYIGNQNTNTGSGQSSFNNVIEISPSNENDVYVGGLCVWRSTNGGLNWSQISAYWPDDSPYLHPDVHDIKINSLNNKVFCANDGGIYIYENNEWTTKFNGLTTSQFYKFERENDEGDIWGGTQDNGILEQNGGGNYYNYITGDGYDVMTDHDYLVDDGEDDDVYLSINERILKDCITGLCDISIPNNTSFFANLAMSPLEEDKIYAGYDSGLWRSTNAGGNWSMVSTQGANWCVSSTRHNDVVYFAGTNGLFRWVTGQTAVNRTPPAPYNINLKITDIDVDRLNENALYVSIAGTTQNAKVFCSANGGISWANLSFNLPNVPVLCIKLDGTNGLYVGTTIGVFYKPANSNIWQPFSNGLPPTPVTEIELWPEPHPMNGNQPSNPPPSPEIWIATFGRGIWYTQQNTPNCPQNDVLTSNVKGILYKEASQTITSSQKLNAGEGTIVKYSAGNKITLTDGFRAWHGAKFKTYLLGCGGSVND